MTSPPIPAQTNDDRELERLNRRYRPALMAFFLRRAANHADAEDMAQDVFIKLTRTNIDKVENTDAYIFQMAANLMRDHARRLRTRNNAYTNYTTIENIESEFLDPARFLLGKEQLSEITAYLMELPERTRTIFILFRIEGIKLLQLAAAYEISTRAVQKHVSKALTHIRTRLKAEGKL